LNASAPNPAKLSPGLRLRADFNLRPARPLESENPMTELKNDQLLTIVAQIAEKHNCKIVDIDLENHILNLDGPECDQVACAIELESVLG
jgi:c-di-GMP-binding flagellar brake protein YcgR